MLPGAVRATGHFSSVDADGGLAESRYRTARFLALVSNWRVT